MPEPADIDSVRVEEIVGLDRILDGLQAQGNAVIITRSGQPAAVVVDLESYRELHDALAEFSDPAYLAQLREARREIRAGEGLSGEDVFRERGI